MWRGLALLVAAIPVVAAAQQQTSAPSTLPPGAVVQPLGDTGPGTQLRRHLTTLGQNPQSVEALIGAGRAALAMDDAQAAITFFARADEIAPRDPRVKAGMASAFVQLEQPQAALSLFDEAIALGAPEAAIAGDRGLAYDTLGEPARAQRDYALALRRNEDPELQRRLALSLAISGRREEALRTIEPQLRRRDRAAYRTQAFILALTGDTAGANRTAHAMMPSASAEAMAPFFARLPRLTAAQKAMAANFGHIPNEGGPVRVASNTQSATASGGPVAEPADRPVAAPAPPPTPRRRPDISVSPLEQAAVSRRRNVEIARNENRLPPSPAEAPPRRVEAPARPPADDANAAASVAAALAPVPRRFQPPAEAPPQPTVTTAGPSAPPPQRFQPTQSETPAPPQHFQPAPAETSAPPPNVPAEGPAPPPSASARAAPPVSGDAATSVPPPATANQSPTTTELPPSSVAGAALPGFSLAPRGSQPFSPPSGPPAVSAPLPSTPAPPSPSAAQRRTALADISDLVNSLPVEEPNRSSGSRQRSPVPTDSATRTRTTARDTATSGRNPQQRGQRQPTPPNPSRHWVQIAGGANRASLPREYARLRDTAPALLRNRAPYVTAARATNRLLVGPFATTAAAQDFVNQLAQRNVTSFAWTSEAGQEIERLQTPR